MIDVAEVILGVTYGTTPYDDLIMLLAMLLAITLILLVNNVFKALILKLIK